MSTVHDTTNLRAYKVQTQPSLDASLLPFLMRELQTVATTNAALIVAIKSLEARIVVGGL